VRYSRRGIMAEICHLLPAPLPETILVIHVNTKKPHNILISLVGPGDLRQLVCFNDLVAGCGAFRHFERQKQFSAYAAQTLGPHD
jgi:hypothetical protein